MTGSPVAVARSRCTHHPEREAAAQCTRCRRAYCRECVVEHERQLVCAACLAELRQADTDRPRWRQRIGRGLGTFAALLFTWFWFLLLGLILLHVPDTFHTVG